jgi:hypothetical protein
VGRSMEKRKLEHLLIFAINIAILINGIVIPWTTMFTALIAWIILGTLLYYMYRHEGGE